MSNAALKAVAGSAVVAQQQDPKTFPGMLQAFKSQIAAALPRHINADRMARVALTCFRLNPDLGKCTPASVFAAVIQASQLGLEPGLNGRAYLIPYGGECQFVPGWKGLVELANRTGRASCWTGAVFDGDEFDYQLGDTPFVKHRPRGEDDPAKLLYVYAVGRIRGNDWPVIEVWPIEKVRKHFNRYNKVGKKHYAHANWEMYARKVPLMQVLKYLPSSPELETAMALSNAAESGEHQGLTIEGAIGGTYDAPSGSGGDAPGGDGDEPSNGGEKQEAAQANAVQQPSLTYADVAAAIKGAKTLDDIDAVQDLIRGIPDEQQRAELDVEARAKRKALKE